MSVGMLWEYEDARGVFHRGKVESIHDFGGTDITHIYRSTCGLPVVLSGARLRKARTLNTAEDQPCPHAEK